MATIKGIGFENFRVFQNRSDFELAPITILTGGNSSGKSTVIKGLKLFQTFWNNPDGQSSLYFEDETHQLGNFEMSLTNNSGKDELILRYYPENHILFGNIFVENVFELDKNNSMKNGELKKSSIFQKKEGETILLYETKKEYEHLYYFINKEEIVNSIIPQLKELYLEITSYRDKVQKYSKQVPNKNSKNNGEDEIFGDYTGPAQYNEFDDSMAYPIINRDFCNFLGINYERCNALDKFCGIIYSTISTFSSNHFEANLTPDDAKDYNPNDFKIGTNSKLLGLIAQIPMEKYNTFENELWNLIVEKYPEISDQFDETSFVNLISQTEKNILTESLEDTGYGILKLKDVVSFEELKTLLKNHFKKSFDSSYRELENEMLKESSFYKESAEVLKWQLNKGLYSDKNKLDLFGNYQHQKRSEKNIINQLFDYIIKLEYRIFGSFNGSSIAINLISKIQKELDNITYKTIHDFSKNMCFIDGVRANTQRLYTYSSQGTSFNSMLTDYMRKHKDNEKNEFLTKWVNAFEMGDSVEFNVDEGIGTKIFINKGSKKTNIVDMGYGITQLLPILMKISTAKCNETIVIEEPETNLHPKLQSKLADMFIDAHRELGITFIVESHSEYLIRKLQFLTAKGEITPEDTVVHYIENVDITKRSSATNPQIRTIRIQEDGCLTQPFGSGFYDEADNLAMELWSFT